MLRRRPHRCSARPGRPAGSDRLGTAVVTTRRFRSRSRSGGARGDAGPSYGRIAARMTSTGAGSARPQLEGRRPLRDEDVEPVDDSRRRQPRAATAVAVLGYGRSTSVCPARSSTSTSSRSDVALTTRSASDDVRRPARRAVRSERASGSAAAKRRCRAAVAEDRGAVKVEAARGLPHRWSSRAIRPSRTTSVLTDGSSVSTSSATASLCGVVTLAPAKPSATSPRSASSSRSRATCKRHVRPVEPSRREGRVLHPRRERLRDRIAEQPDEPGLTGDHGPP